MRALRAVAALAALATTVGCAHAPGPGRAVQPGGLAGERPLPPADLPVRAITQLVVVTTASWDTTGGTMRRYERRADGAPWSAVGAPVPVVVGRTGIAWDDDQAAGAPPGAPVKREGDGRAPAGLFPLDTVFGFATADAMAWVRLPYRPLTDGSECVDDVHSTHYSSIVDRGAVGTVDWNSSERMRAIGQYKLGVTVRYNTAPPRVGRGSCIFMHIWAGPGTSTAGCTAMAEHDLTDLVMWMDPARHPALVQLTVAEYARLRERWALP